jgi:hypothetical protein
MLLRQSAKSLGVHGESGGGTPSAWPQKDGFPRAIKPGWTVHLSNDGRLYYCKYVLSCAIYISFHFY